MTPGGPDIFARYFKLNTLYEYVLASTNFDAGFPNAALVQARFFAGQVTGVLDRKVDLQVYAEFIELEKAYFSCLEYGKNSDMLLQFKYLGASVAAAPGTSYPNFYFTLEFETIPFTITSNVQDQQILCEIIIVSTTPQMLPLTDL